MAHDDAECVGRVLSGDTSVFEELVHRYARLAGAIAFGILGDRGLRDDAVQEAFFKAFKSLSTLKDHSKFKSWFVGIVRAAALDMRRKRRVVARLESIPREVGSPPTIGGSSQQELELVRREDCQAVAECLDDLPAEDRLVLVLKHMEGLSYKEIAEITETTTSAVESRLFRARKALRSKLDREES